MWLPLFFALQESIAVPELDTNGSNEEEMNPFLIFPDPHDNIQV